MKTFFQHIFSVRWLIPIGVSLFALSILWHKSALPVFFSRYSYRLAFFFLLNVALAAVLWWISLNPHRYTRLYSHINKIPVFSLALTILGGILIFDFSMGLIDEFKRALYLLGPFTIVCVILAMLILSSENPRIALGNVALLTSSVMITVIGSEVFFRLAILDYKVPRTEKGFKKLISSSWPHPIPVESEYGVFRVLGLADSFGRAGENQNYTMY